MDLEGKPVKKPFKPFLTQPRRKFKGNFDKGHNGQNDASTEETDVEDLITEDCSSLEDPLVNLTKAPTLNVPESQVGQLIRTKVDVLNAKNWPFPR